MTNRQKIFIIVLVIGAGIMFNWLLSKSKELAYARGYNDALHAAKTECSNSGKVTLKYKEVQIP